MELLIWPYSFLPSSQTTSAPRNLCSCASKASAPSPPASPLRPAASAIGSGGVHQRPGNQERDWARSLSRQLGGALRDQALAGMGTEEGWGLELSLQACFSILYLVEELRNQSTMLALEYMFQKHY